MTTTEQRIADDITTHVLDGHHWPHSERILISMTQLADAVDGAVKEARRQRFIIYAAVIEWPRAIPDADVSLVMERTAEERDAQIEAELRSTADALMEPDWRDVIAAAETSGGAGWADWVEAFEHTTYEAPFVTLYEQEV